ncbi:nitroreductase family protein [Segatella albensis]|jgi:nitroreductase|uniref:nitroreductase family protein n=1 Tax=Segatella albensis TaxID=77768 RepID=UPI000687418E|nr:nitroreductase family protein [Segatella albensis]
MTIQEAIEARHSVRAYKSQPLTDKVVKVLNDKIAEINKEGSLHIQLIQNEPKAFLERLAKYGKFRNVTNYLIIAGEKSDGPE